MTQMPGRDLVNATQINTLLSAINAYMVFLTNAGFHEKEGTLSADAKNDGGALMAASNSLIAMSARLDKIIADDTRWSMLTQNTLESSLLSVHEAQKEYLRVQQKSVYFMKAPHARFHPIIARLEDGRWAAIYGDPATSQSIIGLGENPEAALKDFDEIFDGRNQQIHEEQQRKNNAVDGAGNRLPDSKAIITLSPATSRRIKPKHSVGGAQTSAYPAHEVEPTRPGSASRPAKRKRRR